VWLLAGLAVLASGLSARAAQLAWAGLGWAAFVLLLGAGLDLPRWALGRSPMEHVPAVPFEDAAAAGPLVLLVLAALLVAGGLLAWRRRDLSLG
jgi:ABC-2 type transport system permease protein